MRIEGKTRVFQEPVKKEQDRTKLKKREFFERYIGCGRYVSRTCRSVGISRWTFYSWRKTDPFFASRVRGSESRTAFRKAMFAEAWAKMRHKGVADVCRTIGVNRWSYYNWCKKDAEFISTVNMAFDAEMKERDRIWKRWLET